MKERDPVLVEDCGAAWLVHPDVVRAIEDRTVRRIVAMLERLRDDAPTLARRVSAADALTGAIGDIQRGARRDTPDPEADDG